MAKSWQERCVHEMLRVITLMDVWVLHLMQKSYPDLLLVLDVSTVLRCKRCIVGQERVLIFICDAVQVLHCINAEHGWAIGNSICDDRSKRFDTTHLESKPSVSALKKSIEKITLSSEQQT